MIRRTALVALAFACIAGCGVRGPLYLPEEKPASVPSTQAPPGSPDQSLDRSTGQSPAQDKPADKKTEGDEGAP